MFSKYMYSLVVLTSINNISVATATQTLVEIQTQHGDTRTDYNNYFETTGVLEYFVYTCNIYFNTCREGFNKINMDI